jgi:hypothetical protein
LLELLEFAELPEERRPEALALLMALLELDRLPLLAADCVGPGVFAEEELGAVEALDELDVGELDELELDAELGVDELGAVGEVGAWLCDEELEGTVCVPGAVGAPGVVGAPGAVGALVDDDEDVADDGGDDVDGADDARPPDPAPGVAAAPPDAAPPDAPAPPPPEPPPDCACAAAALAIASATAITT